MPFDRFVSMTFSDCDNWLKSIILMICVKNTFDDYSLVGNQKPTDSDFTSQKGKMKYFNVFCSCNNLDVNFCPYVNFLLFTDSGAVTVLMCCL